MKLMLKIVIALAVITTAAIAYAEVPDVTKWSCPNALVQGLPGYDVEVMECDSGNYGNAYLKVSGELIYIHEHRKDADKTVYYNALKNNEGNWVEVVNDIDLIWKSRMTENRDIEMGIVNNDGDVIAERLIPLLKK